MMKQKIEYLGLLFLITFHSHSTNLLTLCDARRQLKHKALKKHYWVTPFPPSTIIPAPIRPIQSPPPPSVYSSPILTPNPPEFPTPNLPGFEPSPPQFGPSPPQFVPSPPSYEPSPPIFLPPVIYPPPSGGGTGLGLWCVAKPTVPDPIIEEAMNYACASGADCDQIQPNGSCYQPDTLIAHASFAFNSYWQRTKVAGRTCDFGGTGMLITKDPSYDGCHFGIN